MKKTFPAVVSTLVLAAGILATAASPRRSISLARRQLPTASNFTRRSHSGGLIQSSRERIATKLISSLALFEPVANDAPPGTQFGASANGMNVQLTSSGIVIRAQSENSRRAQQDILRIRVRGADPYIWKGENRAAGDISYFLGNDPKRWRTNIARFQRVETGDANGVQLSVYGTGQESATGRQFEYDLRTDANANPAKVRLELNGARGLKIDRNGDLLMRVGSRELRMKKPAIYEQVSFQMRTRRKITSAPRARKGTYTHSRRGSRGMRKPSVRGRSHSDSERRRPRRPRNEYPSTPRKKRRKKISPFPPSGESLPPGAGLAPPSSQPNESSRRIDGGYVLEADGSVGFWIGKHDPDAAILIDPAITLTYASFLGGAGAESVNGMAMDASGNVYIAGTTTSAGSFPETANDVAGNTRGVQQLFLAKVAFSSSGAGTLQYLAFFGGSNKQAGGKVSVDANGNAAVLGTTTSSDYPVTDGSAPTQALTSGTGNDLVVSEIDPTGSNLIFSTIFGGNGAESANAAAGIPLTSTLNLPAGQGGIAFDAAGNIYVASDTSSTNLPTTSGAFQPAFDQTATDSFLAIFQTQSVAVGASNLLYCSYLGTNSSGSASVPVSIGGVAVDSATPPNVYIAGTTENGVYAFPALDALQATYGGGASDAFLMELLPAGNGANDLIYATLLGGAGTDAALAVAVDGQTPANAYVVGATQSQTFPETPVIAGPSTKLNQPSGSPSPGTPPIQNAFLAVVAWNSGPQTSSLQYFTYLGGYAQDAAEAVAVPFPNTVYLGGTATSYNFGWSAALPPCNAAAGCQNYAWHDNLQPFNGIADAFVAKLDTTQSGASSLKYATPLGGTFITPGVTVASFGNAIAADAHGDVYVAGGTTAATFPTAATTANPINGFQQICGSCQQSPPQPDAFIAAMQERTGPSPALSFGSPNVNFGSAGVEIGTPAVPQPFAIVNTGDATLNFSTVNPPTVTGVNSGDFSIVGFGTSCPLSLTPGQSCGLELNFEPSAAGVEAATVAVYDDAPGSPQLLEVTGVGLGPATLSPAGFAFGDVPVNTTPSPIVVKLTAGPDLYIQAIQGPSGPPFVRDNSLDPLPLCQAANTLSAGTSCDIGYTIQPTVTGTFQAEVDITGQVNGQTVTEKLPMTATAVPPAPAPVVLPTQLIFRSASVGSSEMMPVTLSNTGTAPLSLALPFAFTGPNAADFVETDNCPSSLPPPNQQTTPDSSCTVDVAFAPQTAGAKLANLAIADNAPGSPQLIALSGTAVAPPIAQVNPSSWNFGSQSVGVSTAPETIAITNAGGTILNFTQAIGIGGTNAAEFQQTNNCPVSLTAGSSCTVSVTFSPQVSGTFAATLNISNNATGSPQAVPLSGTGAASPQIQIVPASLLFGAQPIGSVSAAQPLALKNTGSSPLVFTQPIALTGANAAEFTESDNCPPSGLLPSLSCTVFVSFAPQSAGSKTAEISFVDNAPNSPQAIAIAATAVLPPQVQLSSTGPLDFGSVSIGTQSAAKAITVTNTGGAALNFSPAIAVTGANASDFHETTNCAQVLPGSSCTVSIGFSPALIGPEAASLDIYDNAVGSPQVVALAGTGFAQPQAQLSASALDFGSGPIGQAISRAIVVTSVGPGQPLQITAISLAQVTTAGQHLNDFSETDNCSGPITTNCTINVAFTPTCVNAPAARAATLTIQDNASTPSQTVALTGAATGDFCISAPPASLSETVAAGATATFPPSSSAPITLVSVNSFSGTINLSCSSNPAGPACSFSPSAAIALAPNLPAQIQVQAATASSGITALKIWPRGPLNGLRLLIIALALLAFAATRRGRSIRRLAFTGAVVVLLCLGFAACGGGGGSASTAPADPPPNLSGSYTLTVTATDPTEAHTLSLHLNVTQ